MIQAESNLVDLEPVIRGAEEVGRKKRGDNFYSVIQEDRENKGGYF